MTNDQGSNEATRDTILKLLAVDRAANVTHAQPIPLLSDGDEYVDLEQLNHGVQRATGQATTMGRVLQRKSVHESTWSRILSHLVAPGTGKIPSTTQSWTAEQTEMHKSGRNGWLRAAVLGSDDAIVSTASLMIGVAAASATNGTVLVAGVAGLVAGAMSMAVGEYVSVSSQRDAERADIKREKQELDTDPQAELNELALIYTKRGLEKGLAMRVAQQLSAGDRLGAHMRDELGIDQKSLSRPMQAAWISAASFALFAMLPVAALLVAPADLRIPAIAALSLVSLAVLGAFGGYLGGAPITRAALRVILGGALAMAVTAVIGRILGVSVG
jgi:VIT1/CCC1 family predicted Fe2+/Mn2+ transporter